MEKSGAEDYWKNKEYYARRLRDLDARITLAEKNNRDRERLLVEKTEAANLIEGIKSYLARLKAIQARAIKENEEFRTRRLNFLSSKISEDLANVFADEKFQANIECKFNRKNRVKLTLTDVHGNEFNPRMCNGMLVQYMVAFSVASCVTRTLGSKNLFVDEAFGVSSMENLPVIGKYLDSFVAEGMQVVLISQNPLLYQDSCRREIWLKSTDGGCVKVVDEIDFGMEG